MSNPRSVLIELNTAQLNYLADLMDAVPSVPGNKAVIYAQIRQQLAQPQDTEEVVSRIKQQALQEASASNPQSASPTN